MEPPKRHVLVELCPEKVVDELTTFILVPIVHGLVLEYKVWKQKTRTWWRQPSEVSFTQDVKFHTVVPPPLDGERPRNSGVHAVRGLTKCSSKVQQRVRGGYLDLSCSCGGGRLFPFLSLFLLCSFPLDLLELTQQFSRVILFVIFVLVPATPP